MKRLLLLIASAGVVAMAAPAATAQAGWVSINQRQANLDARIDAGVRSGDLTRREAMGLRAEFNQIASLEARYRVGGLSIVERRDLDRRFDALSGRIRYERADNQDRNDRGQWRGDNRGQWQSINQRQANLDRRIDMGLRNGSLTRVEAFRLRAEFRQIAALEARYRQDGLSFRERADLDRRFDNLSQRIRYERADGDTRHRY